MTFKELEIGQRFRRLQSPAIEWVKVEPVKTTAHRAGYNAVPVDGEYSVKKGFTCEHIGQD